MTTEAPPATATGVSDVTVALTPTVEVEPTSTPAAIPTATTAPEPTISQPTARQIRIITTQQLTFDPTEINVDPGETVTFLIENPSSAFHTFTIAISTGKEEILTDVPVAPNATEAVTLTFPENPATLYLFCRPHEAAGMIGRVQVGEGAAESSLPPTAAAATPSPTAVAVAERVEAVISDDGTVQRASIVENIYPGYFEPNEIVVRVGIPVELEVSTKHAEHVNQISIRPWVTSSAIVLPGRPITIRFTPDRVGEFPIRNVGHGFQAKLIVIE